MPTYSTLTLTFTNNWVAGDRIKIVTYFEGATQARSWQWVASRSGGFEVTVGTPTATPGERSAFQFEDAFDLDVLTGYVTTQSGNQVIIQSELDQEFFVLVIPGANNSGGIEAVFGNTGDESTIEAMLERYYVSYCDDFNTDRRVSILQKGFVGIPTALTADVNPISVKYESSEDFKFSPIRPSTAEVFLIFDTEGTVDFEEFWTADEKEFQVQDIKDDVVEWVGYVIPNGFSYEFVGGKYHASIEASDGLGTLESIPFVDDNQKPYGNQDLVYNDEFEFPPILILTEILKKLELDLDLWTCVDSYEKSMTKTGDTRDADPLATCYFNVKTYIKEGENKNIPYWYGSGEEWNCKEVLENLLYIFGAKLYQEYGVWRVKSINADIDYGTGATQRYWRKYNTVATYLSNYEVVDDQVNIPCNDTTKFLIGNSHVMSMDTPYKSFRYNYEFTFVRDGDTPINVLPNSSFCDFNNTSILSAPTDWKRWQWEDKWYIRIKDITVPFADAGGNTCGIEIGTHKSGIPTQQGQIRTDNNPAIWTSLQSTSYPYVEKGAKLTLDVWNKYRFQDTSLSGFPSPGIARFYPVYKMLLWTGTKVYCLVNSVVENKRKYTWTEAEFAQAPDLPLGDYSFVTLYGAKWFYLDFLASDNGTSSDYTTFDWWHFIHELAPTPEAGYLELNIHGLATTIGSKSNNYPQFLTNQDWGLGTDNYWLYPVVNDWIDQGGDVQRLQITGLTIGRIPNESEFAQQQDYVYDNTNTNYSYQTDPITIYHGDVINENHVSGINVPTNTTGIKNFWDDLSGSYGNSSLGLLTVRQIMRQYQKPYRILEGDVKIQDARFGSIYTFSVLPNVRFLLQRGTFNKQKQYIEGATFIQITDDVLADAGYEGGDSLDPDFQPTNNSWCEVVNGLNTGYVVTEEIDINPNSETYQETRETVSVAQDLTSCPLNIPRYYYWGSDDIYLNTATLSYSPLTTISSKEIQISLNNNEGNYLYFVHKKVIDGVGQVVERIYTPTSPNNVLSDWVYLNDVIIEGYIYRVLRTDYTMTAFNGFIHNFVFA